MKKFTSYLVVLLIASCNLLFGQDIENGLVGYYKMDEGSGELLTNSAPVPLLPPGQISNPVWSDTAVSGTALYFDLAENMPNGDTSYVDLGTADPTAGTNQLTFSCWMKWLGINNSWTGVTGKRDDWTHATIHWDVCLVNTDGHIQFEAVNSAEDKAAIVTDEPPLVGVWQNFTVTYNGTTAKMYMDGVMVKEGDIELGTMLDAPFHLGCAEKRGKAPFYGYLDEVRYYNRALSDEEVVAIYELDLTPESGIHEKSALKPVILYPNPVDDKLEINAEGINSVKLFDVTGKLVMEHVVTGNHEIVNVSDLETGIYILKAFGKYNSIQKFAKK
jgi:hypothetical protein